MHPFSPCSTLRAANYPEEHCNTNWSKTLVNGDVGQRLWAAADQLWANTGLKPAEFSAPVLGLIFLKYADRKYAAAEETLGPVGSGGRRKVSKYDWEAIERVCRAGQLSFPHLAVKHELPESTLRSNAIVGDSSRHHWR